MTQIDAEQAKRVTRQHAEASRLQGVDFIAVGMPASKEESAPVGPPAVQVELKPPPPGRDRAASQRKLDNVLAWYLKDAPHKSFNSTFQNIVFGEGDPCARLMFVGEAPGADEDESGRPFVGRAGQLLDRIIAAMGLRREEVYIANVLKTRPPNNATPTPNEAALCAPYLHAQIDAVSPEALVTLGVPATHLLLNSTEAMARLRGRWWTFTTPSGKEIPVMPTYHPAYLLRQYTDDNRKKVWSDMQMVMTRLGIAGTSNKA